MGFTVMPHSGDVVVSGKEGADRLSLYVFSLIDGKLKKTNKLSLSCSHENFVYLSSLIVDDREKLVVKRVNHYKFDDTPPELVDLQTGEWSSASTMGSRTLPQLNSRFLDWKMCYIPSPVNALVHCRNRLVVESVITDKMIWNMPGIYNDIIFDPKHNVLVVADEIRDTVLIVNPENGREIQTIILPDMGSIYGLRLYKDQIVMLHFNDECKISYYNLL